MTFSHGQFITVHGSLIDLRIPWEVGAVFFVVGGLAAAFIISRFIGLASLAVWLFGLAFGSFCYSPQGILHWVLVMSVYHRIPEKVRVPLVSRVFYGMGMVSGRNGTASAHIFSDKNKNLRFTLFSLPTDVTS